MPFTLRIEVDGQHELDLAFKRAADTLDDCSKYWPRVADVFYDIEKEQFASEGSRGGTPWAKLSPAYAEWKERYLARETFDARNQILQLTGALKRSLTSRDPMTGPQAFGNYTIAGRGGGGIYIPEPHSLTLGSSLPYALAHQRRTSNMPARQPINLRAEDARRMRKAFRDPIAQEVKRAGWPVDEMGLSDFYGQFATAGADDFSGLEWVDDL